MIFENDTELVRFVVSGSKLPEWQTELFSKYRNEIQVHSQGELFYKLDTLFPNEHPASKEHRVLSFESVTKGDFWKGVNNVNTIFQNSSYTVAASENTVRWITQDNFENQDLFSFFLEKWCENALTKDPNSLIVVYPFDYIKGKTFSQVLFIPSEHIKYRDNETVVFISEEESEKDYQLAGGRVAGTKVVYDNNISNLNMIEVARTNTFAKKIECKIKRHVYHVFTLDGFYRVEQPKEGDIYSLTWWKHNRNFLPCISTGGTKVKNDIYESFFSVFVPFGNLALLQHSQHTAVNFTFSFPRMSEVETPCEAIGCNSGWVTVPISGTYPEGKRKCDICVGTGYTTIQSPYKTYKRRLKLNEVDDESASTVDYDDVKFYTPETSILDYSKNEWKGYLEMAGDTLYISRRSETGNVESAKSKEKDREDRYNFLNKIAKVFYDRLRTVMQFFENYMNANPAQVSVNIPFSFAIVSEMEAFESLQTILKSDAPVLIKANQVEAFINKFISQASPIRRCFNILKKIDLLLFYTDGQIASQKMGGVVTATQWAVHVYAFPLLFQMLQEERDLFDLEDSQIIEKLNAALEPYKPDEELLKQKLLNQFN